MNEDDTFERLRKPSFQEVYTVIVKIQVQNSNYYDYLMKSVEYLTANHWTVAEYGIALKKKFQADNNDRG